jgi:hypothetical protein
MNRYLAGAAIAALALTPLSAQPVSLPVHSAGFQAELLTLNAGTPITLAMAEEVNSSTHREGQTFKLTVLNDVRVGETTVIPRGTPAIGEITWRTGKGAFGKSGKLEFALRYIDLNGQKIPVTGDFRQEGEGNTVATGVGVIAIGVFAGFITGKRARIPVGRELMSQIAQPVSFTDAGSLAPSYDSEAAMVAADAKTPVGQCKAQAAKLPPKKQEKAVKDCYVKRLD